MNIETCLILGSNSDLGEAIAYKFAEEGYNIVLASRKITDYQSRLSTDLCIKKGIKATNVLFEGNELSNHSEFVDSLPVCPDIVISVFGYLGNHEYALNALEETLLIINSNYVAHVSILNIFANIMERRKKGTIIGISSVAGERGRGNNYIYGSAKAAFTQYLSGLRNRLSKSNVHVITVIPGYINTKMISHLKISPFLIVKPEIAAKSIFTAYMTKKNKIYISSIWRFIMYLIKIIPENIFKKINF